MTLNQFIYKVSRPFGSLQIARFLARNHPRILMYHRISPNGDPGTISVDQFRKQMKLIKESFNAISLSKLVEAHEQGNTPKHAVAVTFDDGYSDFADYAFPILQEEGIPATLFITTGFVNGDIWLWPDQIKHAIESSKLDEPISLLGIPEKLHIKKDPEQSWHRIADYCMTIENDKKLSVIEALYSQLGLGMPKQPPKAYRPVTWDQLRPMLGESLEVQSHSVTHPILTQVDDDRLNLELNVSKKQIIDNLSVEVAGFCYPNGQVSDYNRNIITAVSRAGYKYSVVAYPDKMPMSDIWSIKRYSASELYEVFERIIYGFSFLNIKYK